MALGWCLANSCLTFFDFLQQFKKNLKGVNGGADFDQEMLQQIFDAIHGDEIVLPEERTGLVKEIYTWKVRAAIPPLPLLFDSYTIAL
mgnify:CR=1 FL=1